MLLHEFAIGITARTLNVEHLRGTGRYVQELLRNTVAGDDLHWTAYGDDPSKPFRVPANLPGETEVFELPGRPVSSVGAIRPSLACTSGRHASAALRREHGAALAAGADCRDDP